MDRDRALAAALVGILLVPATAGCSRLFGCAPSPPEDITVSDLAGAYAGDDGASIELREDGQFSANDVPGLKGGPNEGTWSLDLASKTSEDMRLGEVQMWISGDRDEPWLYRFDGDPDNCDLVEFHRDR
ncbi:hypothetical protein Ais01nite_19250 [Asanoa ishikariensis]|uniref:Lipoprotein n=1 Tax=Asanoa ishikariensis TaxID=137265 RepID=A0A1H3UDY9_9ACTN|nr:hypothetical protein [Asanoa ishikariensis]GIF63890.1 hypothetical protein Ais01nite_19250 [Asanoa ishikariensis]SDZ59869.1 hypothetical protein SAMN05421684_6949 [Asanoa ishikariensis]